MRKRINNVYKKYVEHFKWRWYEDINDIYNNWSTDEDITKEQLYMFAERKINLFVKKLYPKLVDALKDENKVTTLCGYIRATLKDNLYNNNPSVFSFFDCIFGVPEEMDDHGMLVNFNISFGEIFGSGGHYFADGEKFRSLIIEVAFSEFQDCNHEQVFQLRCSYDQAEAQYNADFERYFNNSEKLIDYLGSEEYIDDYYQDYFRLNVVEIVNPALLHKELLNKNLVQEMNEEMKKILR